MIILRNKEFSEREKVPQALLDRAKTDGVIQKDNKGNWRIISIKAGEFWNARYSSKEKAEAALRGYQANKH